MRRILLVVLFLAFFTPSVYGAVTNVSISPSNPEQGDVIVIDIQADPDEEVEVSLDYSGDAPVSGGEYEIILYDVLIPNKPNRFSAEVIGVENLKIGVKYGNLPWVRIQKEADGGVATISQRNIPTGTYNIKVSGDALSGETSVDLSFSADITLIMDNDGTYSYSYDTEDIPPGTIEVNVGGEKRTITLSSSGGSSSGSNGGVAASPVADFIISGDRFVGEEVRFDASSSDPVVGSITKYSWSFGDESIASSSTVTHTYSEVGEYTVQLTVTNTYGLTDEKTYTITIDEIPNVSPIVTGGSERICLPDQILVFKSQSSDSDGVIVEYLWSFGDGEVSEGRIVQHSWENPGQYTVNHTVVDDRGASASTYYSVKVEELTVGIQYEKELLLGTNFSQYFSDLGASITVSGNNTILYFFKYVGNPSNSSLPNGQIGSILDLVVSDPDSINWPIYVEVDYPRDSVDNITETSLGLYYYQDETWSRCVQTGVDPNSGVVWANLTRSELTGSPLTVGVVEPLPSFAYHGLSLLSPTIEENEAVVAVFNVSNSGDKSGNIISILYLDESPVASRNMHLEPNETKTVTVRFNVPTRGEHTISLGDLVRTLTVLPSSVSDLVGDISSNVTRVEPGDVVSLIFDVNNNGNRTAYDFSCVLVIDGLRVTSVRVDELDPMANMTWSYDWIAPSVGEYNASFIVDVNGDVDEMSEENNAASLVFISEKPFPVTLVVLGTAFFLVLFYLGWRFFVHKT